MRIYFLSLRDKQVINMLLVLREARASRSRVARWHTRKYILKQEYTKLRPFLKEIKG
jgi:hypothetical protein